ncbi:MAG: serine hydrolase [Chroococcidiopsidaceae cyanobacterium CP_BM_ER_R8_30]|nr:serine hydrolase [Chroococcidiopsidaceae cyanobacterium CP_BM_ER_R8_30]
MGKRQIKKIIHWAILALLLVSLSGLPSLARKVPPSLHQQPSTQIAQAMSSPGQGPTDPQEMEAFFDKFLAEQMPKAHAPGAAVSVVKDGNIFFSKGYGYANLEKKIPVVPDRTLFRVASLSKLFTETAVMQLYERGLLKLDENVNHYLKSFQVQNPFPQPQTVADLLTQTSGLNLRYIGIASPTAAQVPPLGKYLSEQLYPLILPPGKFYLYTDDDVALLGYLVQELSGVPFPKYIEQNLLQPLDMHRSSFLQPVPPALASELAQGYRYKNGSYQQAPFIDVNFPPAASLSTTATDMAHFMIAHLQLGRYHSSRILQEDTARLMHQQHFLNTKYPQLPGSAYSFHEWRQNNIRAIGHSGNLIGYTSILFIIPEQNLGFFFVYNSFGFTKNIQDQLFKAFIDHYYPAQPNPAPQPPANFQQQVNRFTGTYQNLGYPHPTPAKVSALTQQVTVSANKDGTLTVAHSPKLFGSETTRLVQVDQLLFRRVDQNEYSAFEQDNSGQIAYLYHPFGQRITAGYEKVSWFGTFYVQVALLAFFFLLFLSACIIWPLVYLVRRFRTRQSRPPVNLKQARLAALIAVVLCILNLAFIIGLALTVWLEPIQFLYGLPPAAVAFLCLPIVTTGMTLGLLFLTGIAWRNHYWSVWGRMYYTLVTLGAVAFIPFLLSWNLLGFLY